MARLTNLCPNDFGGRMHNDRNVHFYCPFLVGAGGGFPLWLKNCRQDILWVPNVFNTPVFGWKRLRRKLSLISLFDIRRGRMWKYREKYEKQTLVLSCDSLRCRVAEEHQVGGVDFVVNSNSSAVLTK